MKSYGCDYSNETSSALLSHGTICFVICSSSFDLDEEILGIQMKSLYQYFHWLLFAFTISYKNKILVFYFGHDRESGI